MIQRGGKVIIQVVPEANGEILKPIIGQNVDTDSVIITDGFGGYKDLHLEFKQHEIINHNQDEYGRDIYHTNTIENVWSNLKRTIKGTHIHV